MDVPLHLMESFLQHTPTADNHLLAPTPAFRSFRGTSRLICKNTRTYVPMAAFRPAIVTPVSCPPAPAHGLAAELSRSVGPSECSRECGRCLTGDHIDGGHP
jgi:hypothetical protein